VGPLYLRLYYGHTLILPVFEILDTPLFPRTSVGHGRVKERLLHVNRMTGNTDQHRATAAYDLANSGVIGGGQTAPGDTLQGVILD